MNLETIFKLTQKQLFKKLKKEYKDNLVAVSNGDFFLVRGNAPIMLVAHLDTVHKESVKIICKSDDGDVWMSPQGIGGDDRCGVYALTEIYKRSKVKPYLLFTCDEEVGCVGASMFCDYHKQNALSKSLVNLKLIIELDRKGENDCVFYDCYNDDFEDYIVSKGFVTAYGSCSDISYIAPELEVAAANLSIGYYNAHTQHEYVVLSHLNATIDKVLSIIEDCIADDFPKYEYHDFYDSEYYDDEDFWNSYSIEDYQHIPSEIRKEYVALLDFHTSTELDNIRAEYGDNEIKLLYDTEIKDFI